jgi:hypothetical protein
MEKVEAPQFQISTVEKTKETKKWGLENVSNFKIKVKVNVKRRLLRCQKEHCFKAIKANSN